MDKERKRRVVTLLLGIIGMIALLVGISFAVFSSDITGLKEQNMKTGCLKVEMTDNGNVSLENAAPQKDTKGLENDPYTYTLTNTCSVDAVYQTTINVIEGSNLDNLSKIKVSLSGDSYVKPTLQSSLTETQLVDSNETNVVKTYLLDEGSLEVGETKTFNLRMWIDYEVTDIVGGLQNKIIVLSEALENKTIAYSSNTAAYQVLKNMQVLSPSQYSYKSLPNTTGLIKIEKDGEKKYYLRGTPDNYIKFGTNSDGENYTWRILSSNNDGSINIVLDSIYQTSTYDNLTANLTNIYSDLETDEKYIDETSTFCEEITDEDNTYIAKLKVENNNPTGACESNNVLTKIGLPSADDLMYAGAVTGLANTSFYLAENAGYYTSSHESADNVYAYTPSNSLVATAKTTSLGIKPVITITKDAIIEGLGTEASPYYITGLYTDEETVDKTDKTAPTITYARVDEEWSQNNKTIRIAAKDDIQGSGISGYIVTTSNETPSLTDENWEASSAITYNTINTYDNGTYYVFAKDASGNISESKKVVVEKVDKEAPTCTILINPNGTKTSYKTLTILSTDQNINKNAYSWDDLDTKKDSIKVTENKVYTAHIEDLAGNKASCSATITNIIPANLDESGANNPVLSENMIPVYYDATNDVWRKADSKNADKEHKWYDYSNKMWANAVTVSDKSGTAKVSEENLGQHGGGLSFGDFCDKIEGNENWYYSETEPENTNGTLSLTDANPLAYISVDPNDGLTDYISYGTYYIAATESGFSTYFLLDYANDGSTTLIKYEKKDTSAREEYKNADPGTVISMSEINTMLVWIPRYKYTVWNYNEYGTSTSNPQEIKIEFEKGNTTTGEINCEDELVGIAKGTSEVCKLKETGTRCTNETCNGKTYTHPAFTFGEDELDGIWVGKFEISAPVDSLCEISPSLSSCQQKGITPIVKPNVKAYRYANVATFDYNIRAMNDNENIYGFASSDDIHMMKPTEWGATAYLSHSKYGLNGKVTRNSNSSYLTGCGPQGVGLDTSGTICNSYETELAQTSSTTGNVYGVYDMSGGSYEYLMGNTVTPDLEPQSGRANGNSGFTGIVFNSTTTEFEDYTGTYAYPSKKYYDQYSYSAGTATDRRRSKLGDIIKEFLTSVDSNTAWYDGTCYLPHRTYGWSVYGGSHSSTGVGIFNSSNSGGAYGATYSTRIALAQ